MKLDKFIKSGKRVLTNAILFLVMMVSAANDANAQQPTVTITWNQGQGGTEAYSFWATFFTNPTVRKNCLGYSPNPTENVFHAFGGTPGLNFSLSAPVTSFSIPMYYLNQYMNIQLYSSNQEVLNWTMTVPGTCTSNYAFFHSGVTSKDANEWDLFYINVSAPGGFDRVNLNGAQFAYNGSPNGGFIIPLDVSKYIVNPCNAGAAQVSLSAGTLSNVCPAPLANLNSLVTSATPAGASLVWYQTPDHSDNPVANPSAVPLGTYYAFYNDATNFCFNTGASTAKVVVSQTICTTNTAAGALDCGKTQLYPAPLAGTASQVDLIVTVNATTAGCFTPITVNGSGFSLAPGFSQACATATGVQQLHIPVIYDGSTLGTLNFSVGSAGSCMADLTKIPVNKIVKLWTLDNCTQLTAGPPLK